jgi:hypothetical protein
MAGLLISHSTSSEKPKLKQHPKNVFVIKSGDPMPNGWDWMLPKFDWKIIKEIPLK